jgi:lysophospholipase L1-like esterase
MARCERGLERARRGVPTLAVVGASFTAGVGPDDPGRSWAVQLARLLHWDAAVEGVPGAGYVRAGPGRRGAVAGEISRLDLRPLAPSLVLVQAGHDDIGVAPRLERQRVTRAITLIRAQAPGARIALITVFAGHAARLAARRTDRAIVTAAKAADHAVIIMDPLTAGWRFAHSRDGFHPTARGGAWIARTVARILRRHGIYPTALARPARLAAAPAPVPVICDSGIRRKLSRA